MFWYCVVFPNIKYDKSHLFNYAQLLVLDLLMWAILLLHSVSMFQDLHVLVVLLVSSSWLCWSQVGWVGADVLLASASTSTHLQPIQANLIFLLRFKSPVHSSTPHQFVVVKLKMIICLLSFLFLIPAQISCFVCLVFWASCNLQPCVPTPHRLKILKLQEASVCALWVSCDTNDCCTLEPVIIRMTTTSLTFCG